MRRAIAALVAVLALSAPTPPARPRRRHLKVGTCLISGYAGVPVALARGYFSAQDLDVEMVFFGTHSQSASASPSGDLDFSVSGSSAGFHRLPRRVAADHCLFRGRNARRWHARRGEGAKAQLERPSIAEGSAWAPVPVTQIGTALPSGVGLMAEKYGFPMSAVKPLQSNANVLLLLGGTVDAAVMPVGPVQPAITKATSIRSSR